MTKRWQAEHLPTLQGALYKSILESAGYLNSLHDKTSERLALALQVAERPNLRTPYVMPGRLSCRPNLLRQASCGTCLANATANGTFTIRHLSCNIRIADVCICEVGEFIACA